MLGEAKTGSGKTLSFVVPMLELLYRERWDRDSGCGALVIAPTKELAMQIFSYPRCRCQPLLLRRLCNWWTKFRGRADTLARTQHRRRDAWPPSPAFG